MPNLAYVNFPLLLTPRMDNRSGLLVVVVLCDAMNRAAKRYIGAHLSTALNIRRKLRMQNDDCQTPDRLRKQGVLEPGIPRAAEVGIPATDPPRQRGPVTTDPLFESANPPVGRSPRTCAARFPAARPVPYG